MSNAPEEDFRALRRRAEAMLNERAPLRESLDPEGNRLTTELSTHQIELELQYDELHRTQVELEESHAAYVDLYELAPVGILSLDEKGCVTRANLTLATLLRTERTRIEGGPLILFVHYADRAAFRSHLGRVMRGDKPRVTELRMRRRDGIVFHARLESAPIRTSDGRMECRTSLADITDRKWAEAAAERTLQCLRRVRAEFEERVSTRTHELSATTELLERMFDDTHLLMSHMDRDFRYVRVNRAYAELDGTNPETMRGRNHFDVFPDEGRKAIFQRVIATGRPYVVYAGSFVLASTSGGATPYWDWTVQPVVGPGGEVDGLLLTLLDVTSRVRLEQEIVRIEERERRMIGEGLHDTVGQQLTAIGYMIDNLEQELISQGVPVTARLKDLRSALSEADEQVRTLSRGVHPAQLASGGLPGALKDLARHAQERFGIPCSCDCPDDLVLEEPGASAMLRIAREAVHNAVQHASPDHVFIVVERRSDSLRMRVRDDGIGIREDTWESDGLGLHIMAHRAEMAGGCFAVERGQNGGTVVSCTVPTAPAEPSVGNGC